MNWLTPVLTIHMLLHERLTTHDTPLSSSCLPSVRLRLPWIPWWTILHRSIRIGVVDIQDHIIVMAPHQNTPTGASLLVDELVSSIFAAARATECHDLAVSSYRRLTDNPELMLADWGCDSGAAHIESDATQIIGNELSLRCLFRFGKTLRCTPVRTGDDETEHR